MYYVRYKGKKKRRRRNAFFLTFALACMGLSFVMAISIAKNSDSTASIKAHAIGQPLPLVSIQRLEHPLVYINVPVGENDSWKVQKNKLELSLSHPEASASFPSEGHIDQNIGFRREEGVVVLELELENLPPIFHFEKSETGYVIKWLDSGLAGKRIAIDPGHGGHDPGAEGRFIGLKEKNIILAIALELQEMLEKAGAEVFMTRSTDTLVDTTLQPGRHIRPDLWMRHDLVSDYSPDFFISIHNNSWSDTYARGIETYYNPMSLNGYHSKAAAKLVQDQLVAEIQRYSRGTKYKPKSDAVLQVDAPAVLAEILFISNKEEEAMLAAPDFPGRAAKALYKGIAAYFLDYGGE